MFENEDNYKFMHLEKSVLAISRSPCSSGNRLQFKPEIKLVKYPKGNIAG